MYYPYRWYSYPSYLIVGSVDSARQQPTWQEMASASALHQHYKQPQFMYGFEVFPITELDSQPVTTSWSFGSLNDATRWWSEKLSMPERYMYVALLDPGSTRWPNPLYEHIGTGTLPPWWAYPKHQYHWIPPLSSR
jgi:hypothetical protein